MSGAVTTTHTYAPFGETSVSGAVNGNAVQYTGRENDGTGLYYYRARYYEPIRGRFVSEDPIGLAGGLNPYAYATNRPLALSDPSGLLTVIAGAGATITAPSGVDVSGGMLLDLSSRPDVGVYLSGGLAGGVNVSADVFAGLIFGDVNTLRGLSTNTSLTVGPLTLTVLSDPVSGEIVGVTGGIGPPSPLPAGASISATPTGALTARDAIDWLRKRLGKAGDPCKAPGLW